MMSGAHYLKVWTAASILALMYAPALAQQAPDIGSALRQVPVIARPEKPAPAVPDIQKTVSRNKAADTKEARVDVRTFAFRGIQAVRISALEAIVKPDEGKSLTLAQLEDVAARITRYYGEQGYFAARAYLPPQEIRDGIVTIAVIEGQYGDFVLDNESLVKTSVLQRVLDTAKDSPVISAKSLERSLLIANDLPGVALDSTSMTAGKQKGTADFVVTARKPPRFAGYIAGDNYGSTYTGNHRLLAGLDIMSPFGMGDKFSTNILMTKRRDLENVRLAYSSLLNAHGLRGEVGVSRTTYKLGDVYKALDALGRADTAEATLSYPFIRSRTFSLEGALNIAHRELRDEIRSIGSSIPKTTNVVRPSMEVSFADRFLGLSAQTIASTRLTFGTLNIKDAAAVAQDRAGANTEGAYGKVEMRISRMTQFHPDWMLVMSLTGQKALGRNLDGSEDMSLAGPSAVKAYPVDEFSAENVYFLNAELLYTAYSDDKIDLKFGVFGDAGYGAMENKLGPDSSRRLADIGLSAYATFGDLFANLSLAYGLSGDVMSDDTSSARALLQIGTTF